MKKLLVSTAVALSLGSVASTASAEEIKLGVFLGLTGPIESLVANMAPAAEAAIAEVSASGLLLRLLWRHHGCTLQRGSSQRYGDGIPLSYLPCSVHR